jgi:hypothetical protein
MWNRNNAMGMLAACLVLGAGAASAFDRLQVHGFFSQAAVHTDANNLGGDSRDGVGLEMRELGANVSYRPDGDWLFSGQALARWAGHTDAGDLRADYAFVDRALYQGQEDRLNLQLGKVKNPYGLYNTTRDVAHTRPSITVPQSIYPDRIRDFFLSAPGVALLGNHSRGNWDLLWQLNVMRPETRGDDLEYLFLQGPRPGKYQGGNSWLGQILGEMDGGRLRLGVSFGKVAMQYEPGPGDLLGRGESVLRPLLLSAEWNEEKWSLTGEYEQAKNQGRNYGLGGKGPEDPNTVEAWYLQGTYRLTPALRLYLRRDAFYFDKEDKSGAAFAAANPPWPGHVLYAKDWVLGVRRDWKAWSLSAEVHDIDGTAWLSPLDTPILPPAPPPVKNWHMILLQAAYRF